MATPPRQRSYPHKVLPVAAPEAAVDTPEEVPVEMLERRRFTRPIPIAQVIECGEEEAWELWSQWSSL